MDQEYLSKWMSLAKLISLYAWFYILKSFWVKTAENRPQSTRYATKRRSLFDKLGTWPDDFTGLIVYLY